MKVVRSISHDWLSFPSVFEVSYYILKCASLFSIMFPFAKVPIICISVYNCCEIKAVLYLAIIIGNSNTGNSDIC